LIISPVEAKPGEAVTKSVNVANVGGQTGSYMVELEVAGDVIVNKTVALAKGESRSLRSNGLEKKLELTCRCSEVEREISIAPPPFAPRVLHIGTIAIVAAIVYLKIRKRRNFKLVEELLRM